MTHWGLPSQKKIYPNLSLIFFILKRIAGQLQYGELLSLLAEAYIVRYKLQLRVIRE